jgi:predicted small metal-binding protein
MNERQVARKIIHHMHVDHGMNVIPADFMMKIKYSINNQNITDTGNPAAKNMPVK